MHARGLRLRGVQRMLAITHPPVLPSAMLNDVGTPVAIISQLSTLPALPLSTLQWQPAAGRRMNRSGRLATPFLYDSFIHNSTPVLSRRTQHPAKARRRPRAPAGVSPFAGASSIKGRVSRGYVAGWSYTHSRYAPQNCSGYCCRNESVRAGVRGYVAETERAGIPACHRSVSGRRTASRERRHPENHDSDGAPREGRAGCWRAGLDRSGSVRYGGEGRALVERRRTARELKTAQLLHMKVTGHRRQWNSSRIGWVICWSGP